MHLLTRPLWTFLQEGLCCPRLHRLRVATVLRQPLISIRGGATRQALHWVSPESMQGQPWEGGRVLPFLKS